MKMNENTKWATFYTLLSVVLAIMGYTNHKIYYYASIVVGICACYWIWKALDYFDVVAVDSKPERKSFF